MSAIKPSEGTKDDLLLALGSVASRTGEQAGALLFVTQLLVRDRLMSIADAKKLVGLLSAGSAEAQRRATAQCIFQCKAKPVRPT